MCGTCDDDASNDCVQDCAVYGEETIYVDAQIVQHSTMILQRVSIMAHV